MAETNEKDALEKARQEGIKEGIREALSLVQELGKASNGQPLTPGFMAFRIDQLLKGKG